MQIQTSCLKEALAFLGKAVVVDKNKPMATSLVELSTHNGALYGYSYDEENYLRIKVCDTSEELNITVSFDLLNGLVSSTTDDEISLTIEKSSVKFKTNVISCKLPKYDNVVIHPKTAQCDNKITQEEFNEYASLSAIRSVLNKRHSIPCYSNVYFGDTMMVTDCNNVIISRKKLFTQNILLSYKSVEILSQLGDFNYGLVVSGFSGFLYVTTGDKTLFIMTPDMSMYQWADVMELFDQVAAGNITITRTDLAKAINTASVLKLEKLYLVFNEKGAFLYIKNHDFKYRLSETPCQNVVYYTNIEAIKKLLVLGDSMELYYGTDGFIKVVGDIYENAIGMAKVEVAV